MRVKDIIEPNLFYIHKNESVMEAAIYMDERNLGAVLVKDGLDFVGIVTERDIMSKIAAYAKDARKVKVGDIMTEQLITIDCNETVELANRTMTTSNIRRIVVTEKNKIIGLLTGREIRKNLPYLLGRHIVEFRNYRVDRELQEKELY